MKSKGQTLVLFIILVPIFLMVMAFVVDTLLIGGEKNKLESITTSIIKDVLSYEADTQEKLINDLYKANNISTRNVIITTKEGRLNIQNSYEIKSIFGYIIGIKEYTIKINLTGYYRDDKIRIEKG